MAVLGRCARREWARSGAMHLTGTANGPPLAPPTRAAELVGRLAAPFGVDARVLGERAAIRGLRRRGSVSCGGGTRMIETADGWLALTLSRSDDLDLLPALCGVTASSVGEAWAQVGRAVRTGAAQDVADRAALLGLACAEVGSHPGDINTVPLPEMLTTRLDRASFQPLVIDLSALWAGPLCTSLLGRAGARVIKIEDERRPDGARRGSERFHDLLNGGKESLSLDFSLPGDREMLYAMLTFADIIVTGSRARAIQQLGIDIDQVLSSKTSKVWIAITAHGWDQPRIGFGDDIAAAAGLVAWDADSRAPYFASDAIADPLTGVVGAAYAASRFVSGKGEFVDLSMAAVCAMSSVRTVEASPAAEFVDGSWRYNDFPVEAPYCRDVTTSARSLGCDNAKIYDEFFSV